MAKKNSSNSRMSEKIKGSEQLVSMIMGVLVVLVVGGLAYRYFQNRSGEISEVGTTVADSEESAQEEGSTTIDESGQTIYVVAEGDNLWEISEKHYGSGYNWVDIARENNLTDANIVLVGQKLTIPNVEVKQTTVAQKAEETEKYTIAEGDSLSKIAGEVYGDIFQWELIWNVNREIIEDPYLIFPGQIITIPSSGK